MSASIVAFPGCTPARPPVPLVTIGRYRNVPKRPPWKASVILIDGVPGWAVEALNHPGGGIGVLGFHRDEATAWEQAATLARKNGWPAERNRRLAIAVARRMVLESRL